MMELAANGVSLVIFIVVNGALLHFVSNMLGFVERHISISFFISIIAGFVGLALNLALIFIPLIAAQLSIVGIFFIVNAIVFIFLIKRMCGVAYPHAFVAWSVIALIDLAVGFLIGILLTVTVPATVVYWVPVVSITALSLFGVYFAVHTVRRRLAMERRR